MFHDDAVKHAVEAATKALRAERDEALAVLREAMACRDLAADQGWFHRPMRPLTEKDREFFKRDADCRVAARALLAKAERRAT